MQWGKHNEVEDHQLCSQRQTAENCGIKGSDSFQNPVVGDFHQGQDTAQDCAYDDGTESNEQGNAQALKNQDIALPRYHCVIY